jgi:hypothetical protein
VDPVQIHELTRELQGGALRRDIDDRISADDLLGFGERSVGRAQLAAA